MPYGVPPTPNVSPETSPEPASRAPTVWRLVAPPRTRRPSYQELHNQIFEEIQAMDSENPKNVLEWMFSNSQAPIPHCRRPADVTKAYRRQVSHCFRNVPMWVQREVPRVVTASCNGGYKYYTWVAVGILGSIDWANMDEQAIRNVGLWLFGIKQLLKGKSFSQVTETFANENSPERKRVDTMTSLHSQKRLSAGNDSESKRLSPVPEVSEEPTS